MKKRKKTTSKKESSSKNVSTKKVTKPQDKNKNFKEDFSIVQFGLGISLCLFSAGLMFLNITNIPFRLSIGIVGILLIATAPIGPLRFVRQ